MICNQTVTWTAFAILAMFYKQNGFNMSFILLCGEYVVEIMIGVKMTCQTCLYAQQVIPTSQLSLQAHSKNFRNAQQRGLNKEKVERMFPLFSFVTFFMKI